VPAVYPKEWLLDFGVVHESMKTVKKPIVIRNMGINDSVTFDWIRQLPVVRKSALIEHFHYCTFFLRKIYQAQYEKLDENSRIGI
jgi:hypothetical protein